MQQLLSGKVELRAGGAGSSSQPAAAPASASKASKLATGDAASDNKSTGFKVNAMRKLWER